MSSESPWNQKQFPFPPPFNPSPAVLNFKDGSVSFPPFPPPKTESNMIQGIYSQKHQMIKYECNTMPNSLSVIHQLPARESRIIQGPYPLINQPSVNGLNMNQDSNLLYHQLSSNTSSVFKAFHPPTDLMLVNKSNGTTNLQHHQLSAGAYPSTDRMLSNKLNGTTYLERQLSSEAAHNPTDQMFVNKSNGNTYLQRQLSSEGAHPPTDQMFANTSNGTKYLQRQLSSEGAHARTDQMFVNKSNGTTHLQRQLSSEVTHPPTDRMLANTSNGNKYLQRQLSSEGAHAQTHQMFVNKSNGTTYLQRQLSSEVTHPLTDRMLANTSNGTKYLQRQLSSEGAHPPIDQMFVNKSNGTTYLQNQLSSEGTNRNQDFHPVTYQLPANESNISQQFCSLNQQLPSTGMNMNQNSNMFDQQLFTSTSQAKNLPSNVLSQNEFNGNPVKYSPDDQQSARKSILSQGSHMIFPRHSKDGLGSIQNQNIPSHQNVGNQLSKFPEMGFNVNHELQVSDTSLYQNSFPQYSEKVCICVIGPPLCGKADLIRTFTGSNKIHISTDRPLSRVIEHVCVGFNTTLNIDIWHGDLTSTVDDIRSLCQSSKSAIVLVYSVAQKSTLSDAQKWIKALQKDIDFNVPIILVGNTGYAHFSRTSSEFTEAKPNLVQFRDQEKDKYGLSAFYECSTYCVEDVEEMFIFAALKAFNRTIQKSVQGW